MLVWLGAALLGAPAVGGEGTTPDLGLRDGTPSWAAWTGATVVVAPGTTLEGATLLVRDGRVMAVGAGAAVPAGAAVIDAAGRWIFPGFVDPYTDYGLRADDEGRTEAGEGRRRGRSGPPQYEAERRGADAWNDAIHPEEEWLSHFRVDEQAAESLLARGVTAVQSARLDGILRGRGFAASLGSGLPNELLLRPRTHHFAAFDKGSSSQAYPGSLMGSIALVRQTLLDARWYRAAHEAHRRDPSREPPEVNRALASLAEGLETLVFETGNELSLLRAGRISKEMAVPMIHLGSNREYRRLEEIAALGQPILLPLAFPKKPQVESYDKALDVSLEDLRHWERAPSNPAALAARDLPFAFTGHGLEEGASFLDNLRSAVRRGLDADTALAALTTVPAALVGIADQVGSLQPGRRGDFVIADGDLLRDKEAKILSTWVAGELAYESEPLDRLDFRGVYGFTLAGRAFELRLRGERDKPRGQLHLGEDKVDIEHVESDRHRLHFTADLGPLTEADGVARWTLVEIDGEWRGWAVLADGDRQGFRVEKTATEAPPEEPDEAESAEQGSGDETAESPSEGEEEGSEPEALVSRLTSPPGAFGPTEPPQPENVLVRGGTVWTSEPQGVLEAADLLVIDGKVAAVGSGLSAPPGVRVIDARGKHVTPGIIDEHSHLAIDGGVNEGTHAVTAEVRIGDVLDPDDVGIYRALAGGVTAAQLLHGSANPIGGQAQVIKLRWGRGAEALRLDGAPPTIKLALGENVKQSNWGSGFSTRYPQTRMGVETIIRDAFLAAREYGRRHRENAAETRGAGGGEPARRDLKLEALWEILNAERFIHVHSYVQSEILMMMRLAEELGFTVQTFTHILEGYKVAPEMAAHGATASTFSDWWAYKFEVYDAIPYNTCLLHEAGVVTSVNSDSAEMIRRLNQEAGKSVLYCDMDEAEALNLVTLNPAIQLRIDDRVGSLKVGKDADFVIWSGHPLSMYSRAEQTWIDGTLYFSLERDRELREAAEVERQALIQKALAAEDDSGGGEGFGERRRRRAWHCDDTEDYWHARSGRYR